MLADAEPAPAGAEPAPASTEAPVSPGGIDVSAGTEMQNELPLAPAETSSAENEGTANVEPAPVAPDEVAEEAPTDAAPDDVPAVETGDESAVRVCANMQSPVLLDFDVVTGDSTQALFGDFDAVLSGGTYVYPLAAAPAGPGPGGPGGPARGLLSDVTAGDWRITGSVIEQAGFGVFLDCQLLDASRFAGIAFSIAGNVGNTDTITLLVGTAENDVSAAWRLENVGVAEPSSGRCTPALNEYDGSCDQARIDIAVSPGSREVFVPFAALGGGRPDPGVNPAEITTLGWALPPPAVSPLGNTQPYPVDLRIDDIRFVEAPPL